MKLLLIQGNKIARYEDRVQKEVYEVDWTELSESKDFHAIIEGIRLGTIKE